MSPWKLGGLLTGIAAFLLLLCVDSPLCHHEHFGAAPSAAAATTALMAIWWLTEALPIYATACAPLILFPLTRPFSGGAAVNFVEAAWPYASAYIFLFAGGMCIAAAMQQWGLHRRIALNIMRAVGTEPSRLLLGFLVATAFVSLWISNTATATMMLPIGLAVIAQFESRRAGARLEHYGAAVMLAIAYGSNIGGIGTKIGTAPNAIFAGFLEGHGVAISFLQFMAIGTPFVAMLLPIAWRLLWRLGRRDAPREAAGAAAIAAELASLGPIKRGEWIVAAVFFAAACGWIAAKPITALVAPRVEEFALTTAHMEGVFAVAAALVLFAWRAGGTPVLAIRSLRGLPWGTLLLLGGSFSMAHGIQGSGLADWLSGQLSLLKSIAPFAQTLLASTATVLLSAVASNTATCTVMMTVLSGVVSEAHRTTILFATTIATSCDFALPVGTPPNAIVFGSGYVRIPVMARTGIVLDLIAALLAAVWCWIAVPWVL